MKRRRRSTASVVLKLRQEVQSLKAEVLVLREYAEGTAHAVLQVWAVLEDLHSPETIQAALTAASEKEEAKI